MSFWYSAGGSGQFGPRPKISTGIYFYQRGKLKQRGGETGRKKKVVLVLPLLLTSNSRFVSSARTSGSNDLSLSLSLSNSFLPEKKSKLIQFEPWAIEEITVFGIFPPSSPERAPTFQSGASSSHRQKEGGESLLLSHLLKWRNGGGRGGELKGAIMTLSRAGRMRRRS